MSGGAAAKKHGHLDEIVEELNAAAPVDPFSLVRKEAEAAGSKFLKEYSIGEVPKKTSDANKKLKEGARAYFKSIGVGTGDGIDLDNYGALMDTYLATIENGRDRAMQAINKGDTAELLNVFNEAYASFKQNTKVTTLAYKVADLDPHARLEFGEKAKAKAGGEGDVVRYAQSPQTLVQYLRRQKAAANATYQSPKNT